MHVLQIGLPQAKSVLGSTRGVTHRDATFMCQAHGLATESIPTDLVPGLPSPR